MSPEITRNSAQLGHLQMPLSQRLMHRQAPADSGSFLGMLGQGIATVNQSQHFADSQVHQLLTGGDVTQAEVMTAVQKADMSFRLLVQVRNKLIAAYEELNAIRV